MPTIAALAVIVYATTALLHEGVGHGGACLLVDGLRADGSPSDHASQHANAYALAHGVAPPNMRDAIAGYVAGRGTAMGPQTAQALLAALHGTGHDADLVARLTDPSADGWANVLARGGTFTWETWQPSDANGDSYGDADSDT